MAVQMDECERRLCPQRRFYGVTAISHVLTHLKAAPSVAFDGTCTEYATVRRQRQTLSLMCRREELNSISKYYVEGVFSVIS